ncbi:hypothetical protein [Lachnoclostridium sp.]|uniref:hypothetical protein n=1 Tax=Lachnoclostridium sp. TaxID=2028282 RepID=UPI00289F981C|nr:hypothetical protein [Lachnoclostridium sp.]
MAYITFDDIIKDRITYLTTFGDALVYIVDDGQSEDIGTINQKVIDGTLYEYIIEKYQDYPIVHNTIITDYHKRYLNPLLKVGFDVSNSRDKYKHAKNNGLLDIIGVIFDIVANWDAYIKEVTEDLKNS